MELSALGLIVVAWMVAGGSPGPATLAISGTSMASGRAAGLMVAAGIVTGSAMWGIAAALGVGAIMMTNAWVFEIVRYVGACYLLFLAIKSARSAWRPLPLVRSTEIHKQLFVRGLLLHLTNPKAIFAWGSIYAIALPTDAGSAMVWQLFGILIAASSFVFLGYAILFSSPPIARRYTSARRWFDAVFAALFGAASLKILTTRLEVSS